MWGIDGMPTNESFFESPQAAAVYKHRLIKTYIPAWAGKVGSTATDRRVVVYDAYSGPGRYANEEPGSPEVLVDTAVEMAKLRRVYTVFSEKRHTYCNQLRQMLVDKGLDPSTYEVRQGPVEDHLDPVLKACGDLPLFLFLDPFGMTIPLDRVVHVLTSRNKPRTSAYQQPKTELLMNFSYEAVRRISGALRSENEYAAKEGQIDALNERLGGDWWHELARDESEGWVQQVLIGFANRVGKKTGFGYITADVADSLEAKPVYELILFTKHPDGLWKMMDAMSMARKDWRQWLTEKREEATGGQVEFRGLDWDDNEAAWIDEIAANVEGLLVGVSGFVLEDNLDKVLGRTLGLARVKHIRNALRALRTRQVISADPKGDLQRFYVARA